MEIFWKNPIAPPVKNPSDAHVDQWLSTPVLRAAFGSQAPFVQPAAVF